MNGVEPSQFQFARVYCRNTLWSAQLGIQELQESRKSKKSKRSKDCLVCGAFDGTANYLSVVYFESEAQQIFYKDLYQQP